MLKQLVYAWPPRGVRALSNTFSFFGLPASRVDWLKIFTLNQKDCLSFAG